MFLAPWSRSRSRMKKKSGAGAGAAKKFAGSPALLLSFRSFFLLDVFPEPGEYTEHLVEVGGGHLKVRKHALQKQL